MNTLRPPVPDSCDPEWRSLMEQCWAAEPLQRPSFTQIAARLRSMAAAKKAQPYGNWILEHRRQVLTFRNSVLKLLKYVILDHDGACCRFRPFFNRIVEFFIKKKNINLWKMQNVLTLLCQYLKLSGRTPLSFCRRTNSAFFNVVAFHTNNRFKYHNIIQHLLQHHSMDRFHALPTLRSFKK